MPQSMKNSRMRVFARTQKMLVGNATWLLPTVTGGVLAQDATYYYRVFTANGTLTVSGGTLTADLLVVAGGGGASWNFGGGGAGGLLPLLNNTLMPNSYSIVVGAGGTAPTQGSGTNGNNSQVGTLTAAVGGGHGAFYSQVGAAGGSGGGGGTGGSGTSGQGYSGALGGGGAGAAASGGTPGNGSSAYSSWGSATNSGQNVSGTYYYAGGGGGYIAGNVYQPNVGAIATGGYGGGGSSAGNFDDPGIAGMANTGGGGGASANGAPGAGGSGLIIVRYTRASVGG